MFGPEYTPEQGEKALRDLHSKERSTVDRVAVGIIVSALLSLLLFCVLGVVSLFRLAF